MKRARAIALPFLCGMVIAPGDPTPARDRPTIIDVHIHALPVAGYPICPLTGVLGMTLADGSPVCSKPFQSPANDDELRRMTLAAFERHNILGVVMGSDISVLNA